MKRMIAKIAVVLGLATILFQVNFPQSYAVVAASKSPGQSASTDKSKPEHGRALALVRKDVNMARVEQDLKGEGRNLQMAKPTFVHIGAIDGDSTEGDWYAVTFKADKNEDEQSFVMATVDVKNEVAAGVSVFRASWDDAEKTVAKLNMQEFRGDAMETKNKTMIIRNGRAFDEGGNEIKGKSASIWGTTASAVTTCDVVCTVTTGLVCWAIGTLLSGGLLTAVAAVACGVVSLYYCSHVCTSYYDMVDAIDNYYNN
ncbi:MAG: hypothetical protein ACOY94_18690 [Bacillota bacterium]